MFKKLRIKNSLKIINSKLKIRFITKFLHKVLFPFKNLSKRNQRIVTITSIIVIVIMIPIILYSLSHLRGASAAWPPARSSAAEQHPLRSRASLPGQRPSRPAAGSESLTSYGSASSPKRLPARRESLIPLGLLLITTIKKKFYVYLLQSIKDNDYYIGQTDNIQRRFDQHNNGYSKSTKTRRPFKLIGFEEFSSQNEARWMEYSLKNHSDKKKKFIDNMLSKKI